MSLGAVDRKEQGGEMIVRKELLVSFGLILAILAVGIILPILLAAPPDPEPDFVASQPAPTASLPLVSVQKTAAVTPAPETFVSENCTYHHDHWMEEPESWPVEILLGERSYSKEDIYMLFHSQDQDISAQVALQLFAAYLNVLHGSAMGVIESTLVDADAWLATNPPGSRLSEFNHQRGEDLVSLLEGYNLGLFGPGACLDVKPTPGLTPPGD
jgi:hypothetical protein